jgi:hypothetical protein
MLILTSSSPIEGDGYNLQQWLEETYFTARKPWTSRPRTSLNWGHYCGRCYDLFLLHAVQLWIF